MVRQRAVQRAGFSRAVLRRRPCRAEQTKVWAFQQSPLGELQTGAMIPQPAQTLLWMHLQRRKWLILYETCWSNTQNHQIDHDIITHVMASRCTVIVLLRLCHCHIFGHHSALSASHAFCLS